MCNLWYWTHDICFANTKQEHFSHLFLSLLEKSYYYNITEQNGFDTSSKTDVFSEHDGIACVSKFNIAASWSQTQEAEAIISYCS